MITRSEISTLLTFSGAGMVAFWNDYMQPLLAALLLILSVIAAFFMVWNRYIDNRMKRADLRKSQMELKALETEHLIKTGFSD